MPKKKSKIERKFVGLVLSPEDGAMLDEVKEWYRTPSYSHTIRLLIRDVVKGIRNGRKREEEFAQL